MATSGPLSLITLRDAFIPMVWDSIKIRDGGDKHKCAARILANHQMDRLDLWVNCDGKVTTHILITRSDMENTSIKEYVDLIDTRINDALDNVLPQSQSNDVFVTEYDEIISAQEAYDKIQT